MPHRKKKAFIEKKKAVTFHLVHRSQRDPLVADENAPQHVLIPAKKAEAEKRKEEQREFGVFFDDDYNYLQHLKEPVQPTELVCSGRPLKEDRALITEDGKVVKEEAATPPAFSINLPSSVFASEFEEVVGLLNKAAPIYGPRLDMDPDIVAALDDDYDYDDPENVLEDDFVLKGNCDLGEDEEVLMSGCTVKGGGGIPRYPNLFEVSDGSSEDEEDTDSDGPLSGDGDGDGGSATREFMFADEETKSRFTEYSMTSSVMRRNEQLTLLDDRFEKFFEQFDDDEIGALDNAELEGFIDPNSTRLGEIIKDYYIQKEKEYQRPDDLGPKALPVVNEEEEEKAEIETILIEEPPTEKWDCETVLSTYSNLYNHPKIIQDPPTLKPIKVSSKSGIPKDVLPERGLTAKQAERMERINDLDLPRVSTQPRDKEADREANKARKQAIKQERKERRVEKKANQMAFKQEKTRQEREQLNLQANMQALKL